MAQQEPRSYPWSETAPKLAQLTNDMLFDDVWERPGLSKRDRSLITVATLIARYRPLAMPFHFKFALENGAVAHDLRRQAAHASGDDGSQRSQTEFSGLGVADDDKGGGAVV